MTFDQRAPLARGPRRAHDLETLAAEQQLEPFPEGLVILYENE
jgi:hypothetical protein